MGWTETGAIHYLKNGAVDRKAECDGYFTEGLNAGHYKVIKSAMKGSVYYGAVMPLKRVRRDESGKPIEDAQGWYLYEDVPEGEREVCGVVMLTYIRNKYNFGYKLISETMGPFYYDCPRSVLSVLTATTDSSANEWRKKCYDNLAKPSISKLPIGTEIQFVYNGQTITLRKSAPKYQFKTSFWMNDTNHTYFSKKRIPRDFKVL